MTLNAIAATAQATTSAGMISRSTSVTHASGPVPEPDVSRDEIEWAKKLDTKMQFGYIPKAEERERYAKITTQLGNIRDNGGYVYEDKTSFSRNPKGIAAVGSIIGRTVSGGYVGYRYSGTMSKITLDTFNNVRSSLAAGKISEALKGAAVGLKQTGIVSLKAGAISGAINAATSLGANLISVAKGEETSSEAAGNVVSDTVGGFMSGVGATVFSGLSSLGLSMAGGAGLALTVMGVAGGAVGSVLTDMAFKGSGLFTVIKHRTTELWGDHFNKSKKVRPVDPQTPEEPIKTPAPLPALPQLNSATSLVSPYQLWSNAPSQTQSHSVGWQPAA